MLVMVRISKIRPDFNLTVIDPLTPNLKNDKQTSRKPVAGGGLAGMMAGGIK